MFGLEENMKKSTIVFAVLTVIAVNVNAANASDTLLNLGISVAKSPLDTIEFQLEDLQGTTKSLSSYRGKVVFLNFWATWCGPCRSEMPSMQRLYDVLKDEGFEIVAVNLQESAHQVKRFLDEEKLTFPVLLDKDGYTGSVYGARSIPTTYLIDREGKIFARAIGAREWDSPEIMSVFRDILKNGFTYQENAAP